MADPNDPIDTPAPRKKRTGRWVWITVLVIAVLQAGPSLSIIFQRGIADSLDWAGYIGYQLGSMAVPLALGCLGLLFRRKPGLGYFVMAIAVFGFVSLGTLTR